MKRELRITGDDFGKDVGANGAIAECAKRGVLTHASLMVAGDEARDAVLRAHALPELSVGLHLVVCDGAPLSPAAEIPDLVDCRGRFSSDSTETGLRLWRLRRRVRPQLEREIRAQIEAFLATGLSLSHVDGHHHLHQHPVVFDVLRRVLPEYAAPRVRLMHEDARGRGAPGIQRSLLSEVVPTIHAALARWHRSRASRAEGKADRGSAGVDDGGAPFRRSQLHRDERVYGLRASGRVDEDYLLWLIPRLCAARVEIYSHPGRDASGERELRALCSPRVRAAIEASPYALQRANA